MQSIFILNTAACFAQGRTGGFCLFGSLNSSEKQRLIELRDAEEGALYPCHKKKIKILKVIILCGLPQHLSCLTTQAVRKMIAEKLFHSRAKVLGSIAVTDCTWGLILSLLSHSRVPLKLMENNLGIGTCMD